MPELYKKNFINLIKKKENENYSFFTECTVTINNTQFKYLVCNVDLDLLKCAVELAKVKSKFTMSQNQASIPRDSVTKLQKCAQGVLAEMFIHILLVHRYDFKVLRYDLERQSFIYSTEEYDLKIYISNDFYEVESRSSNIHHRSIKKFIMEDVIIGPYGNKVKIEDELADFHFRPIYVPDFIPFTSENGKYHYSENMINGDIKLVITGVATKEDFLNHGFRQTLGQKGTSYQVVKVLVAGDIDDMDNKFSQIME